MSRERENRFDHEIGKKIKREIDTSPQMGRRVQSMGPPATSLNTVTPCAACKLLRRRCAAEECPFSPYFPPHEPHKFAAVHKVFGASNVSKMLMEVSESQRADAANSLVYEANVRLRDPVYGCMGAISTLQQQVQYLQAELNAVRAEILKYRYSEAASNFVGSSQPALASSGPVSVAVLPPFPAPATPPPASVVVSSPIASSLYASTASRVEYNSISTDNASYFD